MLCYNLYSTVISHFLWQVVEVGGVFLLMFGLKVILQRAVGGGDDVSTILF